MSGFDYVTNPTAARKRMFDSTGPDMLPGSANPTWRTDVAKTKAASIGKKIGALDRQIRGLKTARHKAEAAVIDLEDRAARRATRDQIDPDKRRGLGR